MAYLILTHGVETVQVSPPDYPKKIRPMKPQVRNMSTGGRIITSNLRLSGALRYPPFFWAAMPQSEYDDLYAFIDAEIDRSAEAFQMTLPDSTVIASIHYWTGIDEFALIRPGNRWTGTLEFREVPA